MLRGIFVPDALAVSSLPPGITAAVVIILYVFELFHVAAALGFPLLPTVITLLILNFLKPADDYYAKSNVPLAPLITFTGPATTVLVAVRDAVLSLIGVFMRPEGGLYGG